MTTPVLLADPHRDIAPHTYTVQVSRTVCSNCKTIHEGCETFAKTHLRAQFGGKYITNLRPLKEAPKYKLPIEVINKPIESVPFCHRCPDPTTVVSSLPYPPIETKAHLGAGFVSTTPAAAPKKPKAPATTTDDLMKGLDL